MGYLFPVSPLDPFSSSRNSARQKPHTIGKGLFLRGLALRLQDEVMPRGRPTETERNALALELFEAIEAAAFTNWGSFERRCRVSRDSQSVRSATGEGRVFYMTPRLGARALRAALSRAVGMYWSGATGGRLPDLGAAARIVAQARTEVRSAKRRALTRVAGEVLLDPARDPIDLHARMGHEQRGDGKFKRTHEAVANALTALGLRSAYGLPLSRSSVATTLARHLARVGSSMRAQLERLQHLSSGPASAIDPHRSRASTLRTLARS